jgi:hypothetical protein
MNREKQDEANAPPRAEGPQDVVLVHGATEDRKGLRVIRARHDGLEVGEVRPLKEGQAISGDVIRLHPRKEAPFLCDVETTFSSRPQVQQERTAPELRVPEEQSAPLGVRSRVGPAQVATQTYRDNWDAIWAARISANGSRDLN